MRDQNGFRLAAEAIHAVGKKPAHESGAVVELADGEGALGAGVGFGGRLDLGCREGLMGLGRAAGEAEKDSEEGTGEAEGFHEEKCHPGFASGDV